MKLFIYFVGLATIGLIASRVWTFILALAALPGHLLRKEGQANSTTLHVHAANLIDILLCTYIALVFAVFLIKTTTSVVSDYGTVARVWMWITTFAVANLPVESASRAAEQRSGNGSVGLQIVGTLSALTSIALIIWPSLIDPLWTWVPHITF